MATLWACHQPRLAAPRLGIGSSSSSSAKNSSLFFGDDLGSLTARLASSLSILHSRTTTRTTPPGGRAGLLVLAATKEKEDAPKKKVPSAVKRARQSEKRRIYNKARKSEIRTRMKKVLTALDELKKAGGTEPDEIKPIEALIGEAYSVIDKAVKVRTLHRNTGKRRKSRLARAKKAVEIALGWYDPANPAPPAVRPPRPPRATVPAPAPAPTPASVPALADVEATPAPV